MKCSNCSNEMTQSRAGWLCISCGHIEGLSAQSHDVAADHAAAVEPESEPKAELESESEPEPELEDPNPEPEPEPASKSDPDTKPEPETEPEADIEPPAPSQSAPWETTPVDGKPESAPVNNNADPDDEPEPAIDKPEPDDNSDDNPDGKPDLSADLSAVEQAVATAENESANTPSASPEPDPAEVLPDPPAVVPDQTTPVSDSPTAMPATTTAVPEPAMVVPRVRPSQAPLNDKPPLTPVTHPRPFNPGRFIKIAAIAIISLVVVSAAAGAGYLYVMTPGQALSDYLARLVSARTSTFTGSLSSTANAYHFTLKLNGKNDITDIKKPKLDLGITGEATIISGTTGTLGKSGGGSISSHIVVADQKLYFQLLNVSLLANLFPAKVSESWYKYDIADAGKGKCIDGGKGSGSFLGAAMLTQVPVKNAAFAGIGTVNGAQALHYRGSVDNTKIKAAIDRANENLPDGCKLNVSADDYKDLSITYDIWHGWSQDRLKVNITDGASKTNSEVILDTANYNKPVKIDAPSNAKDVNQLLTDIQAKTLGAATANATLVRDDVRKADLRRLQAQLDAYAASNSGLYPSAAVLAEQPFNGTDPTTLAPYQVIAGKPATVGQIQYRRSANCDPTTGTFVPARPTSGRAYAMAMLLDDGTTSYCVDHQSAI